MLMPKTTRILIIVIVLLVLGGGGFLLFSRSHSNPQIASQKDASQNQISKSTVEKKSLRELITTGGNHQCTFSDTETGSSGTVYAGNGKVRGDFQAKSNEKTTYTHMVEDGTSFNLWIDGQTKGYKMSLAAVEKMSASVMGQYQSQAVDMQKQVDYSCKPWPVDGSKFVLPSTVTFQDYTSMMQGVMKGTSGTPSTMMQDNQAACGQCDNLPAGSAQTQCRVALKC